MARKKPEATPQDEVPVSQEQTEKVEQAPIAEDQVSDVLPTPPEEPASTPKSFPVYEGKQVVEILEENVNGQWHHCKLSDGTTAHVPVALFD